MSSETNKAIIRHYVEEVQNKGNLSLLDEIAAPSFVNHSSPPGVAPTLDGVKQLAQQVLAAFPDGTMTIEDMVAEGDKVATRKTFRGTHQGTYLGLPPTGRRVEVGLIDVVRFEEGKAVEHWLEWDMFGMLQQLGALPTPGQMR